MEIWPVSKLDKKKKKKKKIEKLKKIDGNFMSEGCDVIVIFPIYDKFGATWKPNSGCIVCKTYMFHKVIFYLRKTANRTKKSLT